jgi:alpha-mannosidase
VAGDGRHKGPDAFQHHTGRSRHQQPRTYNAKASPIAAYGTWLNSQHKESQQTYLMSYGYGDGGGGPNREMLENIREMADFPALPRTNYGRVRDFFQQVEAESGDNLPVWNGELYLELHRGTYTTQGRNKRANRKSEFLLHDAEFLAALAALLDANYAYPADGLRKAWELVCLNQFHDIIPGSSITPVYTESLKQYEDVYRTGVAVRDAALGVIAQAAGGDLLLANTTAFPRADMTFWPEMLPEDIHLALPDGTPVQTQAVEGGMWIAPGELPPMSVVPLRRVAGTVDPVPNPVTVTPTLLENDYLRVELNSAGDITRIYDRQQAREVLPEGAIANQLQAFEDRPLNWDAWDVDIFYDDKLWTSDPAESVTVTADGPLRGTLTIKRRILNSTYTQQISLAYNAARLDFVTTIDWQESHILLKAAFPVEVLSPVATYEIQFGNVQRPTHHNTSWDWARFETVAQKWVDLSEGGYGVSLLNDCKYGHDIRDNVIRISLLRSPSHPDPEADRGQHTFTYSLLPHDGPWDERTVAAAYALNAPIVVAPGSGDVVDVPAPALTQFVVFDQPHVVLETVKQAEDGRGIIVRAYESQRKRGPVTLRAGFTPGQVFTTNLLEEDGEALVVNPDGTVTLDLNPYQIITLRLIPA